MPRTKKPAPATDNATDARADIPPSKTSHLFAGRKPKQAPSLSHDRIAADIAAFRKAGGKVEVLGTTRVLKNITPSEVAKTAPRPATAGRAR